MAGTLLVWGETIAHNRSFEQERDVPRFRAAFRVLAGRRRQWPAPADFLDALPRIEPMHGGELRVQSDASIAASARAIAALAAKLRVKPAGRRKEVNSDPVA